MNTSRRSVRSALLAAAMAVSFAGAALAQEQGTDIDWKKGGKWEALAGHIGTYDYDGVLKHSGVKSELEKITKGTDIDLSSEFEVKSPIGFENDCLVMKGNRVHKGDTNRSYLETCLFQGTVNLAVFDHNKITVYTKSQKYQHLSEGLRAWIYFQNNDAANLATQPSNLQMVIQPQ